MASYIFLTLLWFIDIAFNPSSCCQDFTLFNQGPGYLELMNSPALKAWGRHQLRVIYQMDRLPGDKVRVIQEFPTKEVIFESLVPSAEYIDTNKTNKPDHKYSAQYLRSDGTVIANTELADWSGWMYCLHEYLGARSVGKTLFPGTHNAGSYKRPQKLQTISPTQIVDKYIYTQDENVEQQLERGARYLDLRIGHYPNRFPIFSNEIWWINHDIIKIRPLRKIIEQIKSFLSRWPNEIIILDLHRFPVGFNDDRTHDALANFLIDQFGPLLHRPEYRPWAWSVTFNELWNSPARILLSYSKSNIANKYNFYPSISQVWGNTDEQEKLYEYIEAHISRGCSVSRMTAIMAQLTPRAEGIVKKQYSLRSLAYYVNANITLAFARGSWGQTAQAVAVDYLSSTGIISAAILQNMERTNPDHICY